MHYNIAVIGGGPGGYVAAIYAAKKKVSVALIEKDEVGGTCLNRGCIPTKTLIKSASIIDEAGMFNTFGITFDNMKFDFNKIQQNKNKVVKRLVKGVEGLLKNNGVAFYKGNASILDDKTIKIDGNKEEIITADKIIIASGSEPSVIPIPGHNLNGVITSNEALSLSSVPKSMVIIGGGVIGVELAYVYNTLGCDVSIIEMLPDILIKQDTDIIKEAKKCMQNKGIKIFTDSKVLSINKMGSDLSVTFKEGFEEKSIPAEKVLLAAGRKPNTDIVRNLPVMTNKTGIVVDEYLRTNVDDIYAIGDVTGKIMLAHVASHQGITAVENALGNNLKMNYKIVPSCIYTHPEIASVGLTELEAKEMHGDIEIGTFPFAASGKAMTMGINSGFVKIICDTKWKEILGVHIIGPNATELIAEATLAIKLECTAEELADTIHAHPTLSETLMEASLDILKTPINKM